MKSYNLENKKFGRLTAIKQTSQRYFGNIVWKCLCECGNIAYIPTMRLSQGHTKSCGCLLKEVASATHFKHGYASKGRVKRLYRTWNGMKNRCYKQSKDSKYYLDKEIKVCSKWLNDFIAFKNWALANGYKNNLTIDRIDSDEDYNPSNCQWITMAENTRKAAFQRKKNMKELFVQIRGKALYPTSEKDLEILHQYKPNQILRCRVQGIKKPRVLEQLNLYWAGCQLTSENTDNKLWNTKEKVDFQCRVNLHFVDPDVVAVKPDGTVIFSYRSIAFANLGHMEANNYFDGAFVVMAKFLGTTVDELIEMVKNRIGVHVDF